MKLPGVLGQLLHNKSTDKEVLLSLYLDVHSVAAAAWSLGTRGTPTILASDTRNFTGTSWEDRTEAVDHVLGLLEDKVSDASFKKVILGLPAAYLTDAGEIKKDVRHEIKTLMTELELEAVGFVPLHQALVYKMKKDEGVPPSVILLGINHTSITISMYKVGTLVGIRVIEKQKGIAHSIEEGLKSFTDLEVLPARMLLYGSEDEELKSVQHDLLKHSWTSNVNFLHFPKIELVTAGHIVESISLAGASELGSGMGEDEEAETIDSKQETAPVSVSTKPKETGSVEEKIAALPDSQEGAGDIEGEIVVAQEEIAEDLGQPTELKEDANVVMVDAESLGFKKNVDILEHSHTTPRTVRDEEAAIEEHEDEEDGSYDDEEKEAFSLKGFLSSLTLPKLGGPGGRMGGIGNSRALVVGIIVIVLLGLGTFLYWALPRATVTVFEIPKDISESLAITIDPTATVVDGEQAIVPGNAQEKSISGEKTIPVNGKKNIGDPAKGTVTIYNKSLDARTFKKGSVLTNGSLQFTLDGDVKVASATESVGSVTFGKADGQITAKQIGTQSNLSAGSEFAFADLSTSTAIARNESALRGGTSKSVTVVTRADYDALVEELSDDLLEKAKQELADSVGGNQKLINETVETAVTEKTFGQEIDQEASQLQGKVTITVSGISVSQSDLEALFSSVLTSSLPTGYKLADGHTNVEISGVKVQKTGKITAQATIKGTALPTIDTASIQKLLAGKSVARAQELLKSMPGVGGMGIGFRFSPTKTTMPINANNISVTVEIQ